MALVIDKHKLIIFHFPKTGGTTLAHAFSDDINPIEWQRYYENNDHKNCQWYIKRLGPRVRKYHKVALVRHPYRMLLSFYLYKVNQPADSQQNYIQLCRSMSFANFTRHLLSLPNLEDEVPERDHLFTVRAGQKHFHSNANGVYIPDETVYLRTDDFNILLERYGKGKHKNLKKNVSTPENYYFYLTDEAKENIYKLYYEDFDFFNFLA